MGHFGSEHPEGPYRVSGSASRWRPNGEGVTSEDCAGGRKLNRLLNPVVHVGEGPVNDLETGIQLLGGYAEGRIAQKLPSG